jgi:hypothetical protein
MSLAVFADLLLVVYHFTFRDSGLIEQTDRMTSETLGFLLSGRASVDSPAGR